MKGGPRKTKKRGPRKKATDDEASDTPSLQTTGALGAGPGSDFATDSQSTRGSLDSTPKKGRGRTKRTQEACLTSTPVRSTSSDIVPNISKCTPGEKQVETSEIDSPCSKSKAQNRRGRSQASQPRQLRKRVTKEQTQSSCGETKGPPAKCRRGRTRKIKKGNATTQSSERSRPRFELEKPDAAEQDESLLSSDLSIELTHHEEQVLSLSFQEDQESDEDDDEEELPSFLMQMDKKPPSITEGVFVWYKFRHYPFWPAMVKSVNRKQKKASILFIDDPVIHKKKGFTVALRNLKPFDCEETNELVCKAKEEYDAAIEWSLELITDYRIRLACGSFSGSFIEYFAHDMSYPVRRKYPQAASERLTIASDTMMEAPYDDPKEDSFTEQQEVSRSSKRLLPDRSHAAHNRANEKLVHFIVKQRMVEERLLAVIRGQQQSRWLRSFLSANRRRVVNIYLEDDQQLDQVYWYLDELYATAMATTPCLTEVKSMERVPFVLDVLLPEAIIYAIAGVDNVSVLKAEEKYLKGRCVSNRERQEFDLMIERQMGKKSQRSNTAIA